MYKKVAILTSQLDTVYESTEAWGAVHGFAGVYNHEYVTDGTITLNEDGQSVTVELLFESKEVADSFASNNVGQSDSLQYDVEIVSEEEVV